MHVANVLLTGKTAQAALRRCPGAALLPSGDVVAPKSCRAILQRPPRRGYPEGWQHALEPFPHQRDAFDFLKDMPRFALFGEQGVGKTRILIDVIAYRMQQGMITAAIVVTKNAVHRQWIEEQVAKHWPRHLSVAAVAWRKKPIDPRDLARDNFLFSMNVEAIITKAGQRTLQSILKVHRPERVMVVYDESHLFKGPQRKRNKVARKLFARVPYRAIATGTPLVNNPVDLYGQFLLLGPDIIGHRTLTTFRAEYCVLGGPRNNWVMGPRNLDRLNRRIAPITYRVRKSVLKLPPKVYQAVPYELSPELRRHYDQMRHLLLTQLDDGRIVTVSQALTQLLRLQQIVHGWLPTEEGVAQLDTSLRCNQVLDILQQRSGPALIWVKFRYDALAIESALREAEIGVSIYTGDVDVNDRITAVERWRAGEVRCLVATLAAGSTGLNLQGECDTVIYHGHTFNAGERWQSEDRVHRIGTRGSVTYFDIVAVDTIDQHILRKLRSKGEQAEIIMDDIREMLQ